MADLKFKKVNSLPNTLDTSTMYFVKGSNNNFTIYLTDKLGNVSYRSPDSSDISTIVLAIINSLKGQPGGLASLDLDSFIEQSISNILSIDGQNGDFRSDNNLVWNSIDTTLNKLVLANNTASDPTRIVTFNNMQGWLFGPGVLTQIDTNITIPYDIALNTDCYINIHWIPGSGAIGNVRWGIEYSIMKGFSQGNFPSSIISYGSQFVDSTIDLIRNYTTQIATINNTNIEPGSTILMRVFRDGANAADTFLGNTSPFKISIVYQCKNIGTRNRVPNFYT